MTKRDDDDRYTIPGWDAPQPERTPRRAIAWELWLPLGLAIGVLCLVLFYRK